MPHPLLKTYPDLATELDIIEQLIEKKRHNALQPGLAIGLVYEGEPLWGKGFGMANLDLKTPMTLDTQFRIASITKTFTAVAILQLKEQGKLSLEDRLSDHLDWFELQHPDGPPINLYHLLTHTSGLPRDATIPHWTDNTFQSWEELVETTKQRKPYAAPLTSFGYSNLGYSLLGGVVESVSGMAWGDYLQQNILIPLGMSQTIPMPKGNESNLATGYLRTDAQHQRMAAPFVSTNGFSPSASFASTVNDLMKYATFHLSTSNHKLLSAYSLRDMHRPHWLNEDVQSGYGLGSGFNQLNEWRIMGHYGGYKGYLTAFTLCREHSLCAIVLSNSINSEPASYVDLIYKRILPELIKVKKESAKAYPAWQDYVGVYSSDWFEAMIVVKEGQLQFIALDPAGMPTGTLTATNEPDIFTFHWRGNPTEVARFQRDESGKVIKFWFESEYLTRHAP